MFEFQYQRTTDEWRSVGDESLSRIFCHAASRPCCLSPAEIVSCVDAIVIRSAAILRIQCWELKRTGIAQTRPLAASLFHK